MIISYESPMGELGIKEPTSQREISIGFDRKRIIIFKGNTPTMWSKYLINNNMPEDLMKTMFELIANQVFYDLRGIVFVRNKTQTIDIALDLSSVDTHLKAQNKDNITALLCNDTASIQRNNDIKRSSLDLDLHLNLDPSFGDLSDFD